ncbi:MAG TPA: dihydrodipicolinate synthase family protein [Chitinophagaceae bacterium]|nr:dihydrodipicolinate synthase family protein [Chitinophagaceae bacterium]
MVQLTHKTLKGNWGTLLLPINDDESIDFVRLGNEIDYLIAAKIDGVYSNGTAGELHNITEDEFDRVNQLLSQKCREVNMPFQVGVSHPFPAVMWERIKRCNALRPSAYQVILPDWVVLSPKEMLDFFSLAASLAVDIPLVLYNPPHAKKVLKPDEYGFIAAAIPQLIGLKVAGGDARWFDEMRRHAASLAVFLPGHLLASGFKEKVGAGAYSNVACINPAAAQRWWQLMQTDIDAAIDLEKRMNAFFDRCIVPFKNAGYSNPALDKFLAAVGGWGDVGTRLRRPYEWIDSNEIIAARNMAVELIPEFFN